MSDPFIPLENKKDHALSCQSKGFSVFPLKNPEHRSDGKLEKEKTEGVTLEDRSDVASCARPLHCNEDQAEQMLYALLEEGKLQETGEIGIGKFEPTEKLYRTGGV